MTMNNPATDASRLALMLGELRLPTITRVWSSLAETSDREGWPAARFLSALTEHELADRSRRRIERHLADARLLPGKTLDSFDFNAVPMVSRAHVMALAANDGWLEKGSHILCFGPPGSGKSHLAAALGHALALEAAIAKLDKYHLLILDDLAYVHKSQAETSVLFELIAARYEHRSLLITANQPFKDWGNVFPDPAMTVAAIDRLVHHSVIFEMNVESYRRRVAQGRKPKPVAVSAEPVVPAAP